MALDNSAPAKASADFPPTVWGDFFIHYKPPPLPMSEELMNERINQLKHLVSGMLVASKDVLDQMNLVDILQHLGIDHHFENEVANALHNIQGIESDSFTVHEVSLRFRLLREHGLWVSPDEFNRFKDKNGMFNVDIINDPRDLLSLYNAAHLLTPDELALEEAISFARQHLESMRHCLEYPIAEQVKRHLDIPLPRTVRRIETLHYISEHKHEPTHNPIILELAETDFNMLQRLHSKELHALSEWWKDLYAKIDLPYARDRIVEHYLWSYTAYYERQYSRARIILAKMLALITTMDDIYDVGATLEEGKSFNEAIQRWDETATSLLPEYLKNFYLQLLRSMKEIEDVFEPHEKYKVSYAKKAYQTLSKAYQQEAEWFHNDYMPTFKEKQELSVMSSGGPLACVVSLIGMGDIATKEALEWATGCTDAVKACGEFTRYLNDISALKNGKRIKDVESCVACYIAEYNVTSEVAVENISKMIEDAWRTTNKAQLDLRSLHPRPVLERVVNLSTSLMLMYGDKKDAFTFPNELKKVINHLYVNPISTEMTSAPAVPGSRGGEQRGGRKMQGEAAMAHVTTTTTTPRPHASRSRHGRAPRWSMEWYDGGPSFRIRAVWSGTTAVGSRRRRRGLDGDRIVDGGPSSFQIRRGRAARSTVGGGELEAATAGTPTAGHHSGSVVRG